MSIELIEPAERSMLCPDAKGTHRVVYWEFLPPTGTFNRTCVAVHGLTRNGRDFGEYFHKNERALKMN
jgi:hypothetical protein